ncbi:NADH-quinone oxidoreductase subunit F [Flavipsychrobacter stenotrophus]|uniref:NADH-quinone oxidoreductase subunit N n=1 Tax=Flavipsychrobacter stenotrophus TaxID=2077091 RepID=A0A2S7SU43_9BACT|nr:NADH-quinone oxidoreductase subunit N [Flavipsychrobacter stenotrophus]PQJ10442.1 NADH-quinone oxidoreductase subunit F [Flavipsychrobacter stenotrophus]
MTAIIATTVFGIIMMFTGLFVDNKKTVSSIAAVLFVALLGINIMELSDATGPALRSMTLSLLGTADNTNGAFPQLLFNNMLRIDKMSMWFGTAMTACTALYILLIGKEFRKVGTHVAEYFALIFFILCGLYILTAYNSMLMLFIGIEIMSIPQYVLAGSDKRNLKSSEASLKYFLMGAFSTGILLMGITLLYGATRTFNVTEMVPMLHSESLNPLAISGIVFIMVALGFKVSAAPMHTWTPDVYDGTPTAFTAFMATIVKAGVFFAFLRLFHVSFGNISEHWLMILAIVTALTLLIGNVTAVYQQSVKRMLAYSSIAQAGFMLFSVLAVSSNIAWNGIILYGVAYSVATIGVFAVLVKMKDYTYDGFNGLAKKNPLLAFVTTIFLFSLAGIPLTGGFMAKYYVLLAVMHQGNMMWLVIFALLMAAISVYYYFRVIIAMYFKQGDPELTSEVTMGDQVLLIATTIIVILLGVMPHWFLMPA